MKKDKASGLVNPDIVSELKDFNISKTVADLFFTIPTNFISKLLEPVLESVELLNENSLRDMKSTSNLETVRFFKLKIIGLFQHIDA